jgi:periplasmic protein CpxP/Spy
MKKTHLLVILVAVLVLLNVGTLGFLLLNRPHGPHPPYMKVQQGPKARIEERLAFTEEQRKAFHDLIEEHRSQIQAKDEEMMAARNMLYAQLSVGDVGQNDSLLSAIGRIQQEVEQIHFAHFEQIRGLCTAEQLPAYNELTKELAMYFSQPKGPKRRH